MSPPNSPRPLSDAEMVQEILAGRISQLQESHSDRSKREGVLVALERLENCSGLLFGALGPASGEEFASTRQSTGLYPGTSLAEFTGIAPLVESFASRQAQPDCPDCGRRARLRDLDDVTRLWSSLQSGVLLLSIRLEESNAASPMNVGEMLDYWGALRAIQSGKLLGRDEIQELCKGAQSFGECYAVLDSATLPLTTGANQKMRELIERLQRVAGNPLTIFVRPHQHGPLELLGDSTIGWCCEHCGRPVSMTESRRRFVGATELSELGELSASALLMLVDAAVPQDQALVQALQLLIDSGFGDLGLALQFEQLALPERLLLRMVTAIAAQVNDTLFFIDEAPEFFSSSQQSRLDGLVSLLKEKRNKVVTFSVERESEMLEGAFQLQRTATPEGSIDFREGAVQLPAQGLVQITFEGTLKRSERQVFDQLASAINARGGDPAVPWRRSSFLNINQLRARQGKTVASELGLFEILFDLVVSTPDCRLMSAQLKKILCRSCLGTGKVICHGGNATDCLCQSSQSERDTLMAQIIKGKAFESWIMLPLTEVLPLFQGYARSAALIESAIAVGAGQVTLVTPIAEINDLLRQALRVIAPVAGTGRDLFRRTRSRREASGRLLLFGYPFLGFTPERASELERTLTKLVLPGDTVAYLDSRVRFKNHAQRVMVLSDTVRGALRCKP